MTTTLYGYDALQARFRRLGQVDSRLMQMILTKASAEAKLRAPRRTGNLRRTIGFTQLSATSGRVFARASYAAAVEKGSRPHIIVPRRASVLAFTLGPGARLTGSARVGANMIFTMRVNLIRGTKAKPYLLPGVRAAVAGSGMANVVKEAWNE